MQKNQTLTGSEVKLKSSQRIVSTTDLKGRITYANQDFIDISGYQSEELIGHGHNIVRHPAMPSLAFKDLWSTIKQGKPWMGIVDNRCKNGDNYWVDAYITAVMEGQKIVGYQSVRLKPEEEYLKRAKALYSSVNNGASFGQKITSALSFNLMGKLTFAGVFATVIPALIASFFVSSVAQLWPLMLAFVLFSVFAWGVAKPYQDAARKAREIFDNDIAKQVYTGRSDELGQLQLTIKMLQTQQETIVWRINDATSGLDTVAHSTMDTAEKTNQLMQQQNREVEQVAAAINQMSATVKEVAQNASLTADATQVADNEVVEGQQVVDRTTADINELVREVESAVAVINKLASDSQQIGTVVDVIRGIAEQTNLLALNAAIEAARAGEQGRGFAVVADEVRTLAARTQSSTEEIQQMVATLQQSAGEAVSAMQQGQTRAEQSADQAQLAKASLSRILDAVNTITDMSAQIATAAEEQSAVSDEITKNVINIDNASKETLEASEHAFESTEKLLNEAERLTTMAKQFSQHR
ncbi:methyl-accepting chemotaxis protein [Pseudoalteromonas spongiae]|uniref:PAS domain-containing methyl-accepting chemotaxis protein n=1 Tax=Pseudoalteromonas spongiae TaxID=298657 RepID=A0ABU8EWU7_9GAMM|nr:PAS domain-containing methyl-accepting chemotaxis protein [Pseudoalteromonas spongiae]